MQPLVKRHANGENTTARARAGFEDDDRCAGLVQKISRAQAGETGADDHNGLVGIEPHAWRRREWRPRRAEARSPPAEEIVCDSRPADRAPRRCAVRDRGMMAGKSGGVRRIAGDASHPEPCGAPGGRLTGVLNRRDDRRRAEDDRAVPRGFKVMRKGGCHDAVWCGSCFGSRVRHDERFRGDSIPRLIL